MEQTKKMTELKHGDRIKGIRGEAIQVINYDYDAEELFYYNERTREFKAQKIDRIASVYIYKY
jgi:dUTPase